MILAKHFEGERIGKVGIIDMGDMALAFKKLVELSSPYALLFLTVTGFFFFFLREREFKYFLCCFYCKLGENMNCATSLKKELPFVAFDSLTLNDYF